MRAFCSKIHAKSLVDIYASKGWYPNYVQKIDEPISEDSLYLNIWKPAGNKENLPILVYIHGGSLTSGSAAFDDYNGEEMARKDVIMITIQYRLGIFGYFAHPDLQKESPNHTTGNYGLLDQIKALRWVNDVLEAIKITSQSLVNPPVLQAYLRYVHLRLRKDYSKEPLVNHLQWLSKLRLIPIEPSKKRWILVKKS